MTKFVKALFMLLFLAFLSCSTLKKFADDFKKEMDKSAEEKKQQNQVSQPTPEVTNNSTTTSKTNNVVSQTNKLISDKEIQECVDRHNKARKEVGVAPLAWSNELANYAQEWAEKIARDENLSHRTNLKYGENCAMTSGKSTITMGIEIWYSEKPNFKRQILTSGNWRGSGHYSQMIWANSLKFGMGIAMSRKGNTYIVANYDPAGNMLGEKAY